MRVRTIYTPVQSQLSYRQTRPKRRGKFVFALVVIAAIIIAATHLPTTKAAAASSVIKSGVAGYCLDVHDDGTAVNTTVDNWHCNDTQAQSWTTTYNSIRHGSNLCLSVQRDSKVAGALVVLVPCNLSPGQVWLRDQNGFQNPNSGLCLALPTGKQTGPVITAPCRLPGQTTEQWTPAGTTTTLASDTCPQDKGDRIACFATHEWDAWQSNPTGHLALLNKYTANTPYEEWCADFISYVYREAGYPFTNGEYNGWDESNANKVQDMGFSKHNPAFYTPKPGDIAYFDYNGGHVEIVVSGGKSPTFVYGNSGTIDPTTDNGQMAANTITHDGAEGQLVYYLSPN